MTRTQKAAQARRELDRRFSTSDAASLRVRPHAGWIKAIRTALGMSQRDLAARMRVSQAAVDYLESAEADHRITLGKLAKVAAAMDCTVVYALVPNSSLEETVQHQARKVAEARLGYVAGTMGLEDQAVSGERREAHLDVYAQDLIAASEIWRSDRATEQTDADQTVGR